MIPIKKQLAFLLSELGVSTSQQLRVQFEEADRQTVKILDVFWPDVQLIAAELCHRKTLSGAAVKRLLADAGG